MTVISTIAGKSAAQGGGNINTGDQGFDISFGLVVHALAISKGVVIPKETELTLDVIQEMVQKGQITPFMDAFSSEPTMSDDVLETSPLGVEALALKGLPKYSLTMKKGQNYYKEMEKITGFGNRNFILGDVDGNWKFAVTPDGDFTGFTTGQALASMTTPATATETEKKTFTFQFTDRLQCDSSYAVIEGANAFPISQVSGVNGLILSFEDANGVVVPAVGDTTLKIKAVLQSDRVTGVEGLSGSNFLSSAGAITAITDDGDNFHTLTVTALIAGTVNLKTFDATLNVDVTDLAGVLLRSNVLTETIA
ncbi:hypothetical protein [uncultured Winogradskyella sp.]|uniref:hypothetical protein n=1 Tax=uncultured Winogradskyella sp. TaxID=395353 RepID=UPI0030EF6118|tara:strand:+ start:279 stop:1205 length:927 start_codon:yes stop_codon:yes gene_type:complete